MMSLATSTPDGANSTSVPAAGKSVNVNGQAKKKVSVELLNNFTDMGDLTACKSYKRETKHRFVLFYVSVFNVY